MSLAFQTYRRMEHSMLSITSGKQPVPNQMSDLMNLCPDGVALSRAEMRLTFRELNERADQFADYLAQCGIMGGDLVAICMERSFDWIVAALGILRAGAAYVPVDSTWPDSRICFSIVDSAATALVGRALRLDRLQIGIQRIDPQRDATAIAGARSRIHGPIAMGSLAYVIYTSGSSGVPKGVEITHGNLADLVSWHRDAFNISSRDRASHLAGLGFDAAVWELWPNLCSGAQVCLIDDEIRSSPVLIQEWMIRECITIGFVPTVHAASILSMDWPTETSLRVFLTGGDTLQRTPRSKVPFAVINNYGPSECTVVATSAVLSLASDEIPSIGSTREGAIAYILDAKGEPVSEGAPGEIYIGGGCVGRGYRNLIEETAKRFLPDPFSSIPGATMFRTGDRGIRYLDGQIRFLGRLDRQVKIHGQRVELDEIGTVLGRHPSIEFATVIAIRSGKGEIQLIAYVLTGGNTPIASANDLQMHLLESLPAHMVPSMFVRLQSLPLSANGKIDSSLLPAPTAENLLLNNIRSRPLTALEDKLITLMRDLLEHSEFGVQDNFFLIGGDSLLGMRLLILIRVRFGVELSLQQIFEASTIERLAILIQTNRNEKLIATIWENLLGRSDFGSTDNFFEYGGNSDLLSLLKLQIAEKLDKSVTVSELLQHPTIRLQAEITVRSGRAQASLPPGVLPLSDVNHRNPLFWVHYLNLTLGKYIGDDQEFIFVTLTREDVETLGERPSLRRVAEILVQKIRVTHPQGPYTLGGLCVGGVLAYEMAILLKESGSEVALIVMLDPPSPPYLRTRGAMSSRFSQPRYLVSRAAQMGLRRAAVRSGARIMELIRTKLKAGPKPTTSAPAQWIIETAAADYDPGRYDGRVLLLLARDRPPHVDFLSAWEKVIPFDLNIRYVSGHHNDLMKDPYVQEIAGVIKSERGLLLGHSRSTSSIDSGSVRYSHAARHESARSLNGS